jgi:CDP-diacylglycerol--glycerol-3-phosphate 3-phosphatidyltransferase
VCPGVVREDVPEMKRSAPGSAAEPWFTWANLVTAVRVVAGVAIFAYAAVERNETWNYIGLGLYWALDVVDGFLARALDQETRLGAQMDILGDRLLVAFFYLNFVALHPQLIVPVALFLVQFMGIDHFLSNQFMRWPISSPNYFYKVDRTIWSWNWSPAGKLLNSAVVTTVIVLTKSPLASSLVCGAIIVLKVWTAIRMRALPSPEALWVEHAYMDEREPDRAEGATQRTASGLG